MKRALTVWIPAVFFACAAVVFYRDCVVEGGGDFRVYWDIAGRVLHGGRIYIPSADIPMGFKYPPWCLPLFLPLAALSFETARGIWAALSALAALSVFYWITSRCRCSLWSVATALGFTWGIWGGEFNHGQVNVLVLAGLLWLWDGTLPEKATLRSSGLLYVSSIKIISIFPLLYFRNFREWLKPIGITLLAFALLSIPAIVAYDPPSVHRLVADWERVAGSAVQGFGPEFARGRMNQGLPVLFGRVYDFRSLSNLPEEIGMVVAGFALAVFWSKAAKGLEPQERWAGWVSWICLVSPLSWTHNFVLALPILSLSVDAAFRSGRTALIAPALLGLLCVGPLTFYTARAIGMQFGGLHAWVRASEVVEHMSIKSIGILICVGVLLKARAQENPAKLRPRHPSARAALGPAS